MTIRVLFVFASLALCACSSNPLRLKDDDASAGVIVARNIPTATSEGRPTLHIKSNPAENCGVIYAIAPETILRRRTSNGATAAATIEQFVVGAPVKAWANMIAESCPGQATATGIELQ